MVRGTKDNQGDEDEDREVREGAQEGFLVLPFHRIQVEVGESDNGIECDENDHDDEEGQSIARQELRVFESLCMEQRREPKSMNIFNAISVQRNEMSTILW